jgi:hypothetical protein
MTWNVLPHRPIEKLSDDLWIVEGDLPHGPMPRTMTLVRLPDRRIIVHSAIALGERSMREIDEWGDVAFIIVPNDHHRLDPAAYRERYPKAQIVCPPGARSKIEEKVKVDATSLDVAGVRYAMLDGSGDNEGYLALANGTLVLGDIVMNLRPLRGFGGWLMNRMGFTGVVPKVVPATKKALVKDAAAMRAQLDALAKTPGLSRVIVAHGPPITTEPASALREAAAALR